MAHNFEDRQGNSLTGVASALWTNCGQLRDVMHEALLKNDARACEEFVIQHYATMVRVVGLAERVTLGVRDADYSDETS